MLGSVLKWLVVTTTLCSLSAQSTLAATQVVVSLPPQKYFVQKIGKDLVDVQVMVQSGVNPHAYEPTPRQMVNLSRAKLYFAIGVAFETAKLTKLLSANPKIRIVNTDHGIRKMPLPVDYSHGAADATNNGHHDPGTLDPHIWLSPRLVMTQVRTITDALKEIDPAHSPFYEANCKTFMAELEGLDARLTKIFANRRGLQFLVYHPSWGYFAHTYGLEQIPIELEGKHPKPAQLTALIEHARERAITVIFVQPQLSSKSATLIAREIGGQVVVADPLAADWMENMQEVASKFDAALR